MHMLFLFFFLRNEICDLTDLIGSLNMGAGLTARLRLLGPLQDVWYSPEKMAPTLEM